MTGSCSVMSISREPPLRGQSSDRGRPTDQGLGPDSGRANAGVRSERSETEGQVHLTESQTSPITEVAYQVDGMDFARVIVFRATRLD